MPGEQVQFKWNSRRKESYFVTMETLRAIRPIPRVVTSVRLKGHLPEEALDIIMAIATEHSVQAQLVLTATWPEGEEPRQLSLWPQMGSLWEREAEEIARHAWEEGIGDEGGEG